MKISIDIKLDEKVLKKHFSPNLIYEYAELIEVLREHGFVHRTSRDLGFVNEDATVELAKQAVADAINRLHWLSFDGVLKEFNAYELGETTDLTALVKNLGNKK